MVPRLRQRYEDEAIPKLVEEFSYANINQVPRVAKVVVNIGLGEATQNSKLIDAAAEELTAITGQKPSIRRAKGSISNFRLREGQAIGTSVTLRRTRAWEFLDRLLSVALPRVRDFKGVSPRAFDGRGNYTLGIREQIIFPEIDYSAIDRIRGLQVTIVTTAHTDEEGRRLLELLGMPFMHVDEPVATY